MCLQMVELAGIVEFAWWDESDKVTRLRESVICMLLLSSLSARQRRELVQVEMRPLPATAPAESVQSLAGARRVTL